MNSNGQVVFLILLFKDLRGVSGCVLTALLSMELCIFASWSTGFAYKRLVFIGEIHGVRCYNKTKKEVLHLFDFAVCCVGPRRLPLLCFCSTLLCQWNENMYMD